MSNDNIARIRYFKGQLLTAKDFEDQQEYHRQKLAQLVQRFPYGIVNGLEVVFSKRDPNDPKSFDAFEIQEGLAVDADGNWIVVSSLRVDVAEFDEAKCYLSLKYTEEAACAVHSLCENPSKNNRIVEKVEHRWDRAPNISDSEGSRITVARIRSKKGEDDPEWKKLPENKRSDQYLIIETENPGEPKIRLDAGLIQEKQIADKAISAQKIQNDAVTEEKIKDGAVTTKKLASEIEAKPKGPAGGALKGTYPNPELADWDNANPETGVHTKHIANGAVTSDKLAIIKKHEAGGKTTFGPITGKGKTEDHLLKVPKSTIVQIIPVTGTISWTFKVSSSAGTDLDYVFTIKNDGVEPNSEATFEIWKINLGAIP